MDNSARKGEILEILYERGRVSVGELAKKLYVSEMTIRRDLSEMESGGYLKRYRGGAVLKGDLREMPISERVFIDETEKKELGAKGAEHLCDNIMVYLDSSSTCLYIIPHLCAYKNIRVVTNSVKALLNVSALHIPCILIGGEYYEQDMCLVGSIAEREAMDFNIDVAFMSTAACSDDGTVSDFDLTQTSVRRVIMRNAAKSIFLFEKSKLGKKLTYTLCRENDDKVIIIKV